MGQSRHTRFAHKYIENGFNGVQAVLSLGWSDSYFSAGVTAHRLLKKAKTIEVINKHMEKVKLDAESVNAELAKIAFADTGEISEAAKMKGLDLATKVLGMQIQKVETTDTSERDSLASALLSSIESASKRDNLTKEQAAIALCDALRETNPAITDPGSWPAEYKSVIAEHLAGESGEVALEEPSQAVN